MTSVVDISTPANINSSLIRPASIQYQQHQRRGRSWREEEEMHNRDEPEDEEFLEDEEFVFNRFDDPDDVHLDWSEGLTYTSSANLRNRRLRHSDPTGRNAKSMELTVRRSGGSAERDYRTRRPERKIFKRGKIFIIYSTTITVQLKSINN
ncbi:unnamed protein product [Hymenolepis diminuta]|uniref:Uncharacterized protein n=1 Tax=Hymenolepis diminuta TaxID=6216 RepID=A0A0R3SNU8_HYMDI|nr:unnamed protein product [Hymenolepis diminuta]